jgi:23S rRNA pseudouridine2605 synthase
MSESPHESAATPPPAARIRLQKFLASCGLGSRRACEEYITAGRVTVDGQLISQLGATVDPSSQRIELDGQALRIERKKYYALNKPRGVVCTNRDPSGRPRIIDLFPTGGPRLFPVGRLDEESEGLIVVTNDGDLSQKLAHPKYRIYRTYHVHVAGVPNRPTLDSLREGAHFSDGYFRVHSAKILRKQGQSSFVELTLAEGQNREVRRLLARAGHKVMRLKRVSFGPIQLGRLKPGEFRELTRTELEELLSMVSRNVSSGTGRRDKPRQGRPQQQTRRVPGSANRPEAARPPRRPQRPPPRRVARDDDDDDEVIRPIGDHPAVGKPPRPDKRAAGQRSRFGGERAPRERDAAGETTGDGRRPRRVASNRPAKFRQGEQQQGGEGRRGQSRQGGEGEKSRRGGDRRERSRQGGGSSGGRSSFGHTKVHKSKKRGKQS